MARFLWTQRQNFGPHARWAHAMVYDAARQRTLLFGGHLAGVDKFAGDTWEWDGQTWVQVADIGPQPRYRHQMVYDSTRQRTMLYGGKMVKDGGATNETWEWDGSQWIQVAETGPVLTNGTMAMAYDRDRARIVLFGSNELVRGETWEWDGDEWTQQDDSGPSARYYATLAYDSARDCTVLFGGQAKGDAVGDTWEWDGAIWKQRADFGPAPRHEQAMVFDDNRDRVVLFGGIAHRPVEFGLSPHVYLGDTWEWDGKLWIQRQNMGPQDRANHALVYDSARKRTILFGGATRSPPYGDTWELAEQPAT